MEMKRGCWTYIFAHFFLTYFVRFRFAGYVSFFQYLVQIECTLSPILHFKVSGLFRFARVTMNKHKNERISVWLSARKLICIIVHSTLHKFATMWTTSTIVDPLHTHQAEWLPQAWTAQNPLFNYSNKWIISALEHALFYMHTATVYIIGFANFIRFIPIIYYEKTLFSITCHAGMSLAIATLYFNCTNRCDWLSLHSYAILSYFLEDYFAQSIKSLMAYHSIMQQRVFEIHRID